MQLNLFHSEYTCTRPMKILVACEESQRVCIEFRKQGHEAYSADVQPAGGGYENWHIQGNVKLILNQDWDMIIAFPPCTYLSNAAACRLYPSKGEMDLDRYKKGLEAKEFFMLFYNHPCSKICIENPVSSLIFNMPKHTQEIQPYQFGHPVSKKTRLWLKGLPMLMPTNIVQKTSTFIDSSTSKNKGTGKNIGKAQTKKDRSKTFPGIAKAMAIQWGKIK